MKINEGDILNLKKPHVCGNCQFRALRVGSDVRILCLGCGRDVTVGREKLEKSIRGITPKTEIKNEDTE